MTNNHNIKRIIGILLIVISVPGLAYTLSLTATGEPSAFLFFIIAWYYWVPSLLALAGGLALYANSKKKS